MATEHTGKKWIYDAICSNKFKYDTETKQYYYSNPAYPHKLYKKIYDPKSIPTIKRGDIINFEGSYRNDNKLIFDGEKLIELYTEIDDYGSVPPKFKVGKEFKPNHWINVIDHNTIIWLEDDILDTIKINNQTGYVTIFNQEYKIYINNIDQNDDEINQYIIDKKPCFEYEDNTLFLHM